MFFLIFSLIHIMSKTVVAQVPADSTAADSALLKQIEQQMQSNSQPAQQPQQTRSTLSFNPDIGVIGDFQGSYISKGNKNFNAYLNETEVSLQALLILMQGRIFFFHLPVIP